MSYQRNPLAAELAATRQAHIRSIEEAQHLRNLLEDARQELRELRADKIRLQARIANLKKYRPQAPADPATPRDESEARLLAATNEAYGRKRAA